MSKRTNPLQDKIMASENSPVLIENTLNTNNTESKGAVKDEVFQLQLELSTLRQRLKLLDGGASKNELLDLLQEKEAEISTKNEQLSILNDKFHKITKAVSQMESERTVLRKNVSVLESENKKVQRYLSIREKEVTSLVARCAAQEEKISDGKDVRVLATRLGQEVTELKSKLKAQEDDLLKIVSLEKQLHQSEETRREALAKIGEMNVKNKENTDGLLTIITSLERQLNDERSSLKAMKTDTEQKHNMMEQDKKYLTFKVKELETDLTKGAEREQNLKKNLEEYIEKIAIIRKEKQEERSLKAKEMQDLAFQSMQQKLASEKALDDTVKRLETENQEELKRIESESKSKDETIKTLLKDVSLIKAENNNFKRAIESVKREKEEISNLCEEETTRLYKEKNVFLETIKKKNREIETLQASIKQRESDISSLKEELASLSKKLVKLEGETTLMTELKEKLTIITSSQLELQKRKEQLETECVKLQQELRDSKTEKIETEDFLNKKLQEIGIEKNNLEQELEKKLSKTQAMVNALIGEVASEKENSSVVQDELEKIKDERGALQQEIKELGEKFQTAQLSNVGKDKEITKLKTGPLKESQDRVLSLTSDVHDLKKKIELTEMEAAEIVNDLEKKVERAKEDYSNLNLKKNSEIDNLSNTIADLKVELSTNAATSLELEKKIIEKDVQLQEMHKAMASMTETNGSQEQNIQALKAELVLLINAFDKSKEDYSRKIVELELDLDQERTNAEDDAMAFQEDYERLQDIAAQTEKKIEEEAKVWRKTEALLEDRTKLLADMVSQNKDLEKDLQEARSLVAELQEESDNYLRQRDMSESNAVKLRKDLTIVEEKHLVAMRKERSLRDELQIELDSTRAALETARNTCKNNAELMKQNKDLNDKVQRQKAYLERKLHQEKVLRERMNLAANTHRRETIKSPTRQRLSGGSTRSSSARSGKSGLHLEESNLGTKTESGDDLEQMLGDDV